MGRKASALLPFAVDGSGRRRVQLGPRLTSGSGGPTWAQSAADPALVLLPGGTGVVLTVAVHGVPLVAGEGYAVAGGFLVLDPAPAPQPRLRRWARAVRHRGRTGDGVDVWMGTADGVTVLRDLRISPRQDLQGFAP